MGKLKLRKYQEEGASFLTHKRRALLADEMGLGKTITALTASTTLGDFPALIVAPKVALYVWQQELEDWYDLPSAIYSGTPSERAAEFAKFKEYGLPYMITNYAFAKEVIDLPVKWRTIICDEIHMAGLLNRKSKTFKRMKSITRKSRNLFLVTGTPVRATAADLWAPLHLINPKRFSSYWRFVHTYCIVIQEIFGKSIERRPQDPVAFRRMLSNYMIRRYKKDVLEELPDKIRQVVNIDMTPKQARMCRELEEDLMTEMGDGDVLVTPNTVSMILRQRQLLTTPKMFGDDEPGGALAALKQLAGDEFDAGNSIVVFTPFRQAIPYIKEVLDEHDAHIYTVSGGMTARDINEQVRNGFQKEKKRAALICVIKSGASFTAHKAPVAFFLGAEWSLTDNLQAEDRLHRLGQKDSVRIKYLLHRGALADELVKERLNEKQRAVNWTLTPEDILGRIKKYRG